jgi:hypothetical protein
MNPPRSSLHRHGRRTAKTVSGHVEYPGTCSTTSDIVDMARRSDWQ